MINIFSGMKQRRENEWEVIKRRHGALVFSILSKILFVLHLLNAVEPLDLSGVRQKVYHELGHVMPI